MKWVRGLFILGAAGVILTGCGAASDAGAKQPDAVTTASIVNEKAAFIKAASAEGTWIIATLNDLTIDQEVIVSGQFHDKNDASAKVYRKIALYTQDDDHKITASFNLTLPKLTVQSENLRIQGGTVKGDVYVEAKGFNLHSSAAVDGNIYYANEEVKASALIEGKVTGTAAVK